ncbi:MAG: oligosaccharide flippase family protein [Rhodothermales bacterium]
MTNSDMEKTVGAPDGLARRVTQGGLWLTVGSGLEQASRLVRNMILARLLAPHMFGTMALVLAVYWFLESFTQIGLREAIVQNPRGEEKTFLNGVWFVSVARALLLYLLGFIVAPAIATFYETPQLAAMLRVAFLSILLLGLISPAAYVQVKRLGFKRWVLIDQVGGIVGVAVSIALAVVYRSTWVLVIGLVAEGFVKAAASYVLCPFTPGLHFRRDDVLSLSSFVHGMLGLPVMTFVYMQLHVFVLGRLVTAGELGIYMMALTLARIPSLAMSKIVVPLLMPAYSEMQRDLDRMQHSLSQLSRALAVAAVPAVSFVLLFGAEILATVYTPEYASAAMAFALLFFAEILQNLSKPIAAASLATGHPHLLRRVSAVRALLVAVLIYPASRTFGIEGAAAAVLLSMAITFVLYVRMLKVVSRMKMSNYWRSLAQPLWMALPLCATWFIGYVLSVQNLGSRLIVATLMLVITYAGAALQYIPRRDLTQLR